MDPVAELKGDLSGIASAGIPNEKLLARTTAIGQDWVGRHLLFRDASKDFLASITQTVRLIRSKGVGIFFVTQTPKDVPADVLAQLGSRVQHQLRAFTPDDAKALRATVSTYPNSGYDLEEVLTGLGTGEAIVTVMNEKGAPSPVAWTRLRAPVGSM